MNPGCSLVDLLLFPIYFQFRKNKGNKTVWPPPLDCTLDWARKRRLAASFEKNAQYDSAQWNITTDEFPLIGDIQRNAKLNKAYSLHCSLPEKDV